MANREYARRARGRRQEAYAELSDQMTAIQREREEIITEIRRHELSKVELQHQMTTLLRNVEGFVEENTVLQEQYNELLRVMQVHQQPSLLRALARHPELACPLPLGPPPHPQADADDLSGDSYALLQQQRPLAYPGAAAEQLRGWGPGDVGASPPTLEGVADLQQALGATYAVQCRRQQLRRMRAAGRQDLQDSCQQQPSSSQDLSSPGPSTSPTARAGGTVLHSPSLASTGSPRQQQPAGTDGARDHGARAVPGAAPRAAARQWDGLGDPPPALRAAAQGQMPGKWGRRGGGRLGGAGRQAARIDGLPLPEQRDVKAGRR